MVFAKQYSNNGTIKMISNSSIESTPVSIKAGNSVVLVSNDNSVITLDTSL